MKSYEDLKAEMEVIHQQMVESKKNVLAKALIKIKNLCKEFYFTARILKDSLAKGHKKP